MLVATFAIIPILGGPLALLLSFLPQAVVAVCAALGAWFGRRRLALLGWRRGLILVVALAAVVGGLGWWFGHGPDPASTWIPLTAVLHIPQIHLPSFPPPVSDGDPAPEGGGVDTNPPAPAPVVAPSDPSLGTPGPWPTFRGGEDRLGAVEPASFRAGIRRAWSFQELLRRGVFAGSPAYADGRVYTSCENGRIYCFEAATGNLLWSLPTLQPVFSSPAVSHGRVFVGEGLHHDMGSCLHCIEAVTGGLLWKFPTRGHVESSPAVADGRIYFGAGSDGVWAITLGGEVVWHLTGPHCDCAPLVAGGKLFFGSGYEDCAVYAVDAATGQVIARHPLPWSSWGSPSLAGDRVLFGAGHRVFSKDAPAAPGRILCLSLADGSLLRQRELPEVVMTTFAVRGTRACFGCSDGSVRMIEVADGQEVWTHRTEGAVLSSPVWMPDCILVGTVNGELLALDPRGGDLLWSEDIAGPLAVSGNGILSSPVVVGSRVFLGGASLDFVAYDARTE